MTKPQGVRILESVETARKRGRNVTTTRKGATLTEREKEVVRIFVASSVKEFEVERRQIAEYFETLNQAHERDGVRVEWYRPETMSRAYYEGGSQLPYDEEITKSRFFALLIGRRLGEYTEAEFNFALRCCRATRKPVILPYFLNVRADMDVLRFQERLKKELKQYVNTYDNLDVVLNHLHIELIRHGAFRRKDAVPSDREAAADKGLDGILELIREQEKRIAELDAQTVTPLIIREKTAAYEEIQRLSQKYDMAPDTLLDYLVFLWEQNLYDEGIELGRWLERFYTLHDPGEAIWAELKNGIGVCYHDSVRYKKAEKYYREALEIRRRLAKANPATFEPYLAGSLNNLALLLSDTNRKEEAEEYHREALEIRRRLAKANPAAFEPDLAGSLDNLGWLLYCTNRGNKAKQYRREALEIRRRLAKANPAAFEPDLAQSLNNLGVMIIAADKMEVAVSEEQIKEAEPLFREAYKIRKRFAAGNPGAFEPYVATTAYNLGVLEYKRHCPHVAKRYFKKALALFEKFPHCEKRAQQCRDALSRLE